MHLELPAHDWNHEGERLRQGSWQGGRFNAVRQPELSKFAFLVKIESRGKGVKNLSLARRSPRDKANNAKAFLSQFLSLDHF